MSTATQPIELAVVHGRTVMREGFGELLNRQPEVRVAGLFPAAAQLLEQPLEGELIVVYDLETARRDGAQRLIELRTRMPNARILMINVPDDAESIVECARAGAAGCILEDVCLDDLMCAIRSLADGTPPASPQVITSLFSYIAGRQGDEGALPLAVLTRREEQVMELLAEGLSNKEIARKLFLQPQTVKNYAHIVFEKLDVHSRLDLMRLLRSGRRVRVV